MASNRPESQPQLSTQFIHIPPCEKERCSSYLERIAKAFTKNNINCVAEYKKYGLYINWFEEAVDNSQKIILHKCHKWWKRVRSLKEKLSEHHSKIYVVVFADDYKDREEKQNRKRDGFTDFFEGFSSVDIRDEKVFHSFIKEVINDIREHQASPSVGVMTPDIVRQHQSFAFQISQNSPTESIPSPQQQQIQFIAQGHNMRPSFFPHSSGQMGFINDENATCTGERDIFESMKDMFGNPLADLLVRTQSVNGNDENLNYSKTDNFVKCLVEDLKGDLSAKNMKHILIQVLPDMYKEKNVLGITYILTRMKSMYGRLQNRAIIPLQLLLLTETSSTVKQERDILINVESYLWAALQELRVTKVPDSKASDIVAMIKRLTYLYMMVLSKFIVICHGKFESLCNIHLETIGARAFMANESSLIEEGCSELDMFMKELCSEKYAFYGKCFDMLNNDNVEKQAKAFLSTSFAGQAVMIFYKLSQLMTQPLDGNALQLLHKISSESKKPKQGLVAFMLQNLLLFLTYRLKNADSQTTEDICNRSTAIMENFKVGGLTGEIDQLMQALLFNSNPKLRELAMTFKNDKRKLYLQQEVERTLLPLFTIESSSESEDKEINEKEWVDVPGHFDGMECRMWLRLSKQEDHKKHRREKLSTTEDLQYNDMTKLKVLHHSNIIQMLAYQDNSIPIFYLLERWPNLQTQMKKQRENQDLFKEGLLLKFLLEALTALEYIHKKGYVHCNLTAESLCIVKGEQAKLCGFQLCSELTNGIAKANDIESKISAIPINWSAPESLGHQEFSTASDVWMFGHLMFEVLTHGLMPYYDVMLSSADLTDKIINQDPFLIRGEAGPRKEHFNLITKCIVKKPEERLLVETVKYQLNQFLSSSEQGNMDISILQQVDFRHSTDHERGVPDLNSPVLIEDMVELPPGTEIDIVDRSNNLVTINIKNGDTLIFREKMSHSISRTAYIRIENGELSDILPGLSILQKRKENPQIECRVSNSCPYEHLLKLAQNKELGADPTLYMDCVYQVAVMLKKLHSKSWVLGDFCASQIYVGKNEGSVKVAFVSLAHLNLQDSDQMIPKPKDGESLLCRAAPEVVKYGKYTSASDVFCFGNFLWEVLTAFHLSKENMLAFTNERMEQYATAKTDEIYQKLVSEEWVTSHVKPENCPQSLYQLMMKACTTIDSRRPSSDTIVTELHEICTSEFGCNLST